MLQFEGYESMASLPIFVLRIRASERQRKEPWNSHGASPHETRGWKTQAASSVRLRRVALVVGVELDRLACCYRARVCARDASARVCFKLHREKVCSVQRPKKKIDSENNPARNSFSVKTIGFGNESLLLNGDRCLRCLFEQRIKVVHRDNCVLFVRDVKFGDPRK